MKKVVVLLSAFVLTLSLCSCGKSEEAQAADDLISEIGKVTLDNEEEILDAEEAVAELSDAEQKSLENLDELEQAREEFNALVEEQNAKLVAEVEDAISQIGEVTLDSGSAIQNAQAAYDALDTNLQSSVSNLDVLTAAVDALNNLQIQQVTDLIAALGTVGLNSGDAIKQAQDALAALPEDQAAQVSNAGTLTEAADTLSRLQQEEGEKALTRLVTDYDKVRGITWYNSKEEPEYADDRCYVMPYIGKDSSSTWLRLCYLYTEDDWIFFDQVTVAVDDERYYDSFNYHDVVRDNDYGYVWEYIDIEPSQSDVDMLWAIANSTETIVRFEGDEYYYDITIKDSDKQAIKDVLTAYEYLKNN